MKWRQFFTPVKSMDTDQARQLIADTHRNDISIIDVRQPGEYEKGHIPGARLIPMGELDTRLSEIDRNKPALVYCAVGGRSRVAAQMMAGKGFFNVINMAGGFKAWNGEAAVGPQSLGLELFSGSEPIDQVLAVAYSIEDGLRDFYLSMGRQVKNIQAASLFEKLAAIEVKHQDLIYRAYTAITDSPVSRERFVTERVGNAIEGGMSTEDYMAMFSPDMESATDIISLAISIEAQALDLYFRASEKVDATEGKKALARLADEERSHINELGKLMDTIQEK
ncbi:rhodanese-like domain-containing protein [Desulfosudis oleivorans]|uniref:Rhodanese domain protein n=1 Tax=Desulfosudis oleivorans (strain DSM 6200 / JCM 39069 / Hxd3) TaxID=96561 RepID=A8ZUX5_DESOH|nr:rhodanese-like domain-containing protein [Desulfosudis oleivorans]ABW68065.1 Rhodanese domain protein [Desulfosudis oleivorans Hxd3]